MQGTSVLVTLHNLGNPKLSCFFCIPVGACSMLEEFLPARNVDALLVLFFILDGLADGP